MSDLYNNQPVWNDVEIPRQESLAGSNDADVCVIGLGGSGLAAVEEALSLEKTVVGIDAGKIAHGAAGRNGGFLLAGLSSFYHETRNNIGSARASYIYQQTLDEIDRLEKTSDSCVRRTGSLRIAQDDQELRDCEEHKAALRRDGFAAKKYNGPEGKGILLPDDAVFHPMKYCRQNVERVLANGAHLFENTPAMIIEPGNVVTTSGDVHAKHIIAAIDGRLENIFPSLRPDVTTYRLQMLATEPDHCVEFPRPLYMRYGFDYLHQLANKRVAMGGFRDVHRKDERTDYIEPTERVQKSIERKLRQLGVTAPISHRWAANVAFTKTGLPVAKEIEENVFAVGAYSATGNIVGRILARAAVRAAVLGERDTLNLFTKKAK